MPLRNPFRYRPLMPADAYSKSKTLPLKRIKQIDAVIRSKLPSVPTVPDTYYDAEGDLWVLNPNGTWTAHHGETRPIQYSPFAALIGPWTSTKPA